MTTLGARRGRSSVLLAVFALGFLPCAQARRPESTRAAVSTATGRPPSTTARAAPRVLVPAMNGAHVPLAQLADIRMTSGPAMICDENGMLAGYVYVDLGDRDIGGYAEEATKLVASRVALPTGHSLQWSGQ